QFELPRSAAAGSNELHLTAKFDTGETQEDQVFIDILPPQQTLALTNSSLKISLFDPKGETASLLEKIGLRAQQVPTNADLSATDILIVGKGALTMGGPAPDISRVRDGLKVIVLEQNSAVLEKRFGFRVEEY